MHRAALKSRKRRETEIRKIIQTHMNERELIMFASGGHIVTKI